MESKLYYKDSYIRTFTTNLIKQQVDNQGNHYVVLEETAFYPTGGGQPHDIGEINQIPVNNVEEVNGEIRHYIIRPLSNPLSIVEGKLDWERRFDHMQQHAGQHILSASFEELFSYKTVSFHLGQDILTIDLDIENLSELEAAEAEKRANEVILANLPIQSKWVSQEDLYKYPLRKQVSVMENIRLVIIPDFDYNGCGGTHPSSTAEVSMVKILGWEKQRQKIRVQFICGNRIYKQLQQKQKIIMEVTKLLNSPEGSIVSTVEKLLNNNRNYEKQLLESQMNLLSYKKKDLVEEVISINGRNVIGKVLKFSSLKELQHLGRIITNDYEHVIVCLISENDSTLEIVLAKGKTVEINMKELLALLLPSINGRGGGNVNFAQGGGERLVSGEELLANFTKIIANT